MKQFIKSMAPGWFAAVMGTSVSSLAMTLLSQSFPLGGLLSVVAAVLHWLAIGLFICLGLCAVARLIAFPKQVSETISHPVEGSFYATFPISALVMAGEWSVYGIEPVYIAALWWLGVVGTILTSYVILFRLFSSERLKVEMVTPGHFIPAVGLVVIPVGGASLAGAAMGLMREIYFGINMFAYGAGVFMYIGLLALTMARHFVQAPIVGKMTPTLWVHLAPLGVIPLSLLALLHAGADKGAVQYALLVASGFMGASLWWLVMAIALTVRNWGQGQLPFALSWWAFVFPVGAITVLSCRLSGMMQLQLLPYVALGLGMLLLFVWISATIGTLRALFSGNLIPKAN